ncbi:MAG: HAD family hydrolase [Pseudomonadota bacterium]
MTNTKAPTRIAMFSGPRNISTTIMRSFENRPDACVIDEPFYGWYLETTGADHPMRDEIIANMPCAWDDVIADLAETTKPDWLQFEKHIAFHFANQPDFDWLKDARPFHLIRDPKEMVASYANKHADVAPIIDSYRVQRALYETAPAPVIDAADVLKAPEPMLRALCTALDIAFDEAMLSWPAGPRESDGLWAAHWYDAVETSTGFRPYQPKSIALAPGLQAVADACADDYAFFYERRLRA